MSNRLKNASTTGIVRAGLKRRSQQGFTIIELLIATAVFSVILIIITTSVIRFTHQYYKGLIASSTQTTSRAIIDDVSRAIQFSGGNVATLPVTAGNSGYCVGNGKRYSYVLNRQVTDSGPVAARHQGQHALVSDSYSGCSGAATPANVNGIASNALPASLINGRELLGQHMRLAKLTITPNGNLYTITVRVIYGDDDLLTDVTPAGIGSANCKGNEGSQFCATSELSTSVEKRVN